MHVRKSDRRRGCGNTLRASFWSDGFDQRAPRPRSVVGEVHGTTEQPQLFGEIVCAASENGRPITAMLEPSQAEQPAWDAFMSSGGGVSARAALMQGARWAWAIQDARSSRAIFELAERQRRYKTEGRRISLRLMIADQPVGASDDDYEALMAKSVSNAVEAAPDDLVIAYSGNKHATTGRSILAGKNYTFAAAHLPAAEVMWIDLAGQTGIAWNCQATVCGPHPYKYIMQHTRRIYSTGMPEGFDAIAYTGTPTTASPPAAQGLIEP